MSVNGPRKFAAEWAHYKYESHKTDSLSRWADSSETFIGFLPNIQSKEKKSPVAGPNALLDIVDEPEDWRDISGGQFVKMNEKPFKQAYTYALPKNSNFGSLMNNWKYKD